MSNSSVGQVLGASTIAGGLAFLPYAGGSPMLNFLILAIRGGMILVLLTFIFFRTVRIFVKN